VANTIGHDGDPPPVRAERGTACDATRHLDEKWITTAEVLQVPWSNGQDQMINSNAVPILNQEAVDAQSSSIDMVSGATFTSQGYIGSLQSAIDQAHL
jgi:uncharacterized protein with FMN-binding domain